jgi:uncharacterized protein (TIGR00645 family)
MNVKNAIQFSIFESRWLLVVFCLGLIVAQGFYAIKFCQEVWAMFAQFSTINQTDVLVSILNLLDMFMIANLIKMIVSGSYQVFVEKLSADHSEKTTSGALKVKMGTSLVGVSGVNLLQTFLNPDVAMKIICVKCGIHLIFLLSAVGLAYIEYLHEKGKALEPSSEPSHT